MPDTRLAVDSNFLMDLARQRDVAHDALEVIRRRLRGLQVFVVPTVFDELANKSENDPDPATRAFAEEAIAGMPAWDAILVELTGQQDGMAYAIAERLLDQGIILRKERNDALILAEAAVLGCQLLISSDSHLRDADRAQLERALLSCGMPAVVIRTPVEIVRDFGGR